jgi:hypothetical protein
MVTFEHFSWFRQSEAKRKIMMMKVKKNPQDTATNDRCSALRAKGRKKENYAFLAFLRMSK